MKISYKHLVNKIDAKPSISELSDKLFQLGHEHEVFDEIFDIEFTPNRGDCLSVNGLARDLKLFYEIKIIDSFYKKDIKPLLLNFNNNFKKYCKNISFLKIEIDEIPTEHFDYVNNYLYSANTKENNFFTDISNYISYETGQPTHCYDSKKLGDVLKLDFLKDNTEFKTLLGNTIHLEKGDLVFLDKNGQVINLAGVIGGKNTACDKNTKSVIIECAHFDPEKIINKAVKYNLNSDAAYKFERGTDPNCHEYVLRRFIKIVEDYTKIKKIEMFSQSQDEFSKIEIPFDAHKINQILGTNEGHETYIGYLIKLGFAERNNVIQVPSYRSDISTINDLSEEIARAIGYDNIKKEQIDISTKNKEENNTQTEESIKNLLISHGFYEVINNPFVSENNNQSIVIDNPLDSNKKFLRTCLKSSLINNLEYNERRQHDSVKLFEISDIYHKDTKSNKRVLSAIAAGRVDKNYEDFSKKINENYFLSIFENVIEPEKLNLSSISRDTIKSKSKSQIIYLEVDLDSFLKTNIKTQLKEQTKIKEFDYTKISDFPCSIRDLSYSVKKPDKFEELQDYILNFDHELLKEKFIFDYYNNKEVSEVKIGFRFVFQARNSTITDDEFNDVINKIVDYTNKIESVSIPGLE